MPALGRLIELAVATKISPSEPSLLTVWAEAHELGVLTQGALTPIGQEHLLDADPVALQAVAFRTVGARGHPWSGDLSVPDLTVMVAEARPRRWTLLDSCADRESRRAAVLWRFSPASVRRALDEGASGDELVRALRGIAETDLPQPLTYLIGDVQHGTAR